MRSSRRKDAPFVTTAAAILPRPPATAGHELNGVHFGACPDDHSGDGFAGVQREAVWIPAPAALGHLPACIVHLNAVQHGPRAHTYFAYRATEAATTLNT